MNFENDGRLYFYYKKDVIYEQIQYGARSWISLKEKVKD